MSRWPTVVLGDLVELRSGGTPAKSAPELWDGDLPWVSPKDVKVERLHDTEDHVSEAAVGNGTRIAEAGTILLVVRSMILAREVPLTVITRRSTFNQDIKAVLPRTGFDVGFLWAWLLASRPAILGVVDEAGHGTKRIQTDRLLDLPVRLPPPEIQRRIASILGAYDDLIEVNRRRIAVLEEIARRLFEEWFVHLRFPRHAAQRNHGELPPGWKRAPISEVYDGLFDGPHATPPPAESGPVFLGISEVKESGQLDLANVRHIAESDFGAWTKRVTPRQGDIVFSYEATLNRYAMIPPGFLGCLGRRMALIRASRPGIARYLFRYFFTDEWRRLIAANTLSGATVQRIPLTRFPTFPVVLPSNDLLLRHEELAAPLARQVEVISEANARLTVSRDLLLPRLVSGNLRVTTAERELEAVA